MKHILDFSVKFAQFNEFFPLKMILEKIMFVFLDADEEGVINISELKRLFDRLYLIASEIQIKDVELNDFLSDNNVKNWIQSIDQSNIDSSDLELIQILKSEIAGLLKKLFY